MAESTQKEEAPLGDLDQNKLAAEALRYVLAKYLARSHKHQVSLGADALDVWVGGILDRFALRVLVRNAPETYALLRNANALRVLDPNGVDVAALP